MMKKLILKIVTAAAFLLLLTFNITTIHNSFNINLGGTESFAISNEDVICYDIFQFEESGDCAGLFWWDDCYTAYDCGPCTGVGNVDRAWNKGTCTYIPVPVVN